MVVTDSFLFPPPTMIKVRVTNMSGAEMIVDVNPAWKCDKLKLSLEPLLETGSPRADGASAVDPAKNSLMFKLLHLRTGATLAEDITLQQQGVKNNDELLLLKRRLNIPQIETDKQRDDNKVADATSIRKATENLPKKHHDCPQEEAISTLDFQSELRRILISLIEASERILYLNPEAAKILKQAEEIYLLKDVPSRKPKLEESAVKQLTDMGFPENRARKALLLNQQSVMSAMDWLLSNESDPDIDAQLPGEFDSDSDGDSDNGKAATAAMESAAASDDGKESEEGAVGGVEPPRFRSILETIRNFQQKEFRPNRRALYNLVEMGFSQKDAADALRVAGNKENAAVSICSVVLPAQVAER